MEPEEYRNPEWPEPGDRRISDWRVLIGKRTIAIWASFSDEQKEAIANDADEEYLERASL